MAVRWQSENFFLNLLAGPKAWQVSGRVDRDAQERARGGKHVPHRRMLLEASFFQTESHDLYNFWCFRVPDSRPRLQICRSVLLSPQTPFGHPRLWAFATPRSFKRCRKSSLLPRRVGGNGLDSCLHMKLRASGIKGQAASEVKIHNFPVNLRCWTCLTVDNSCQL